MRPNFQPLTSEAALQIIETFHEKELLDKVVQIKQVDSDPTIPKKKVAASSENGQKRTNSGQATLVPKRPRLEKKTEGDTKVGGLFKYLYDIDYII